MPVIVVAAITSKVKPARRVCIDLPQGKPLPLASQILAFQVTTIDKSRLDGYLGVLDASQLEELKAALRLVWDL